MDVYGFQALDSQIEADQCDSVQEAMVASVGMDVEESVQKPQGPQNLTNELMSKTILLIQKGVENGQPRMVARAVRQSVALRKYIKGEQVCTEVGL